MHYVEYFRTNHTPRVENLRTFYILLFRLIMSLIKARSITTTSILLYALVLASALSLVDKVDPGLLDMEASLKSFIGLPPLIAINLLT